jgi:hypothetical protein
METLPLAPLSPLSEEYSLLYDSAVQSAGTLAQLPCTYIDRLTDAHIHPEEIERLIIKHNRVSFPIMRDDCFVDITREVADITSSKSLEARLKKRLDIINSKTDRQFEGAGDSIHAQMLSKAIGESQISLTMNLCSLQSLNDAKVFVVNILPVMVQALQMSNCRKRSRYGEFADSKHRQ